MPIPGQQERAQRPDRQPDAEHATVRLAPGATERQPGGAGPVPPRNRPGELAEATKSEALSTRAKPARIKNQDAPNSGEELSLAHSNTLRRIGTRAPRLAGLEGDATAVSGAQTHWRAGEKKSKRNPARELKRRESLRDLGLKPGQIPELEQDPFEVVSRQELLKTIPSYELRRACASGEIRVELIGHDDLVDTEDSALLILKGQLALALFSIPFLSRELKAQKVYRTSRRAGREQAELTRRQKRGPLIHAAQKNVAIFIENDLLDLKALDLHSTTPGASPAAYATTPALVIRITRPRLERLRTVAKGLADRQKNAERVAKNRLFSVLNDPPRADIADFFIRQGKSVANLVRVRNLDKCLECWHCEQACEERFGKQRLFLNGKVKGVWDFVNCCQTCIDQRCVAVCEYDAISYVATKNDQPIQEVLIQEDRCTGCGMCASACPYDAIVMADRDQEPGLWARLKAEKKLGFDNGKRKLEPLRIASKCDHCVDFEDQACLTACPTGALLELRPSELFVERTGTIMRGGAEGFSNSISTNFEQLFRPDDFLDASKPAAMDQVPTLARDVKRSWLWVYAVSVVLLITAVSEILLEVHAPDSSLRYLVARLVSPQSPAYLAELSITFRSSSGLGYVLGVLGSLLLLGSALYSVFLNTGMLARKIPQWVSQIRHSRLRRLAVRGAAKLFETEASAQHWFYSHIWSGALGALLILLHSGLRLNPVEAWSCSTAAVTSGPATTGAGCLALLCLFGLAARYVVPRQMKQAHVAGMQAHAALTRLRQNHSGVLVADHFYERFLSRRFEHVQRLNRGDRPPVLSAFVALVADELMRPVRGLRLRWLLRSMKDPHAKAQLLSVIGEVARCQRNEVLSPILASSLGWIATLHKLLAALFLLLALVHIGFELFIR